MSTNHPYAPATVWDTYHAAQVTGDVELNPQGWWVPSLLPFLVTTQVQRVLDVGCGTRGDAVTLAQKGYHVTGMDYSNIALARARAKAFDHSPSLHARLPEATADLLRSRACFLPDTARKMVARLKTTLQGNRADRQSCVFEHFDPFCYALLPKIGDGSQRQMLLKESYQMKRTHR